MGWNPQIKAERRECRESLHEIVYGFLVNMREPHIHAGEIREQLGHMAKYLSNVYVIGIDNQVFDAGKPPQKSCDPWPRNETG